MIRVNEGMESETLITIITYVSIFIYQIQYSINIFINELKMYSATNTEWKTQVGLFNNTSRNQS